MEKERNEVELHSLEDMSEKKRALVLCNGELPSKALLDAESERADIVLCCDGAAEYALAMGLKVDYLIGDFDSLGAQRSEELAAQLHCERLQWPEKKDCTDSQLAADLAWKLGCRELVFLGALGKRFDHALANAMLLIYCKQRGMDACVVDERNIVRACCTHLFIHGKKGDYLSIVPIGVNVQICTTLGLEYPMYDRALQIGDSYSISNRFTEEQAYVEVAHGWVLVIQSWDESRF